MCEPDGYEEAHKVSKWKRAMEEEISIIQKNSTQKLVEKPLDKNIIGVKWIFKTKLNAYGSINKHKARLVVKGYTQVFGFDYLDTFALVARLDTIRLLFAIATHNNQKVFQLDVQSTFLNVVSQKEIYVEQPARFVVQGEEDKVYLLKKALYGLKQTPRALYGFVQ